MKLSFIKTKEQLDQLSDAWYHRTLNLADYMNDESNPKIKREQAKKLWGLMLPRMLELSRIYFKLSQPKYPKGGIVVVGNDSKPEMILPNGTVIDKNYRNVGNYKK